MSFFLEKNDLVLPGSFLAYEEEYMAGQNAFGDEKGNVYSTIVGYKELDKINHEVNVKSVAKTAKRIEKGDIVKGKVAMVKDNVVLIDIREANGKDGKKALSSGYASLVIFNIADEYVNSTRDMFRIGDIVKARVADVKPYGVELETKALDLGVIKAYGVKTRQPLMLINGSLRDPSTGETEERKVSSEYVLR